MIACALNLGSQNITIEECWDGTASGVGFVQELVDIRPVLQARFPLRQLIHLSLELSIRELHLPE